MVPREGHQFASNRDRQVHRHLPRREHSRALAAAANHSKAIHDGPRRRAGILVALSMRGGGEGGVRAQDA